MEYIKLTEEEILQVIKEGEKGVLATVNPDNTPYAIPIHYIFKDEKIYFHGNGKGKKLDNIMENNNVCLQIHDFIKYVYDEKDDYDEDTPACNTNSVYNSVNIFGKAEILDDLNKKKEILNSIVGKYTPGLKGQELPEKMINGTAVVEIEISEWTGESYR